MFICSWFFPYLIISRKNDVMEWNGPVMTLTIYSEKLFMSSWNWAQREKFSKAEENFNKSRFTLKVYKQVSKRHSKGTFPMYRRENIFSRPTKQFHTNKRKSISLSVFFYLLKCFIKCVVIAGADFSHV